MTRIVNTNYLAAAIGRTPARVRQLKKAGIIPSLIGPNGCSLRNAFPLWESVRDFSAYKCNSKHCGRPSVGERSEGCDVGIQSIFGFADGFKPLR
jgi:hypothetical protein